MAKGISVKLKSYQDTVPKLLSLIKLNEELKKHNKIVLKPYLSSDLAKSTKGEFVESVLQYCLKHKNPEAQIFIAEGADGASTMDLFDELGYKGLSEKYSIGLIDLNDAETKEIRDGGFLKFNRIMYPEILMDSFVISLPFLNEDAELEMIGSLSSMIGAFPSSFYKGVFSSKKKKIRKEPIKYAIHDILKAKMPDLAIIDASAKGSLLAGQPLEMDKQAARLLGKEWKSIQHLKLLDESFSPREEGSKRSNSIILIK
ncbi:DUF362 domain-containing protein [Candidatus Pacearchaeota archaeon]|nr:hypothetical protein [uncultured archaeon]AQS33223.1 hypothetical protein [uncultured archaeon]MBS3091556.1 DUF362 domain-containing protein [Candidatus Pacearchaeota archaeon]